ncbi:trehalose-phosphatase [bacterium]|nr:trehalose-phosphatase [bacterium]
MKELQREGVLAAFMRRLGEVGRGVLLLDYDGTLAPFRPERDAAHMYAGVREALSSMISGGGTRVVVISGRPASALLPLLGLAPAPEIWGCHGAERLHPNGRYELMPLDEAAVAGLSQATAFLMDNGLQRHCEPKPAGVALHTRGLPDDEEKRVTGLVAPVWREIASRAGLSLRSFDGGHELRVPGVDKGRVVEQILAECAPDEPVAFLGDDLTDEDAFAALSGRGLSVLVRTEPRPTAAEVWLVPPKELLAFFTDWSHSLARSRRLGTELG